MRRLLFASAVCLQAFAAPAADAQNPVRIPNHGMIQAPVKSYYELRFENVVRQERDLSCGAAALATIMKFYYGIDTSEKDIIDRILKDAAEEQRAKIAKSGFSMLELKRMGEDAGFSVGGFKIDDVKKLSGLRVPAITLTKVRGYNHFVVIKGVRNGIVHIADPAFGNRARSLGQFDDTWNKVVLVFVDRSRQPKSAFRFDGVNVTPTREVVVITDRLLRTFSRGAGEF